MSMFAENLRRVDDSLPVYLVFNETVREIPYDMVNNRTVAQLYQNYADLLGVDVSRIKNYVLNSTIIPSNYVLRPGERVVATVNSEGKG